MSFIVTHIIFFNFITQPLLYRSATIDKLLQLQHTWIYTILILLLFMSYIEGEKLFQQGDDCTDTERETEFSSCWSTSPGQ